MARLLKVLVSSNGNGSSNGDGKEAKREADRARYHDDPERFKAAARERYQQNPEVFRQRSRDNRAARTPEEQRQYLGHSRSYYEQHADDLKRKKRLHHAANREEINRKRRMRYLEQKKQEKAAEAVTVEEPQTEPKTMKSRQAVITQSDVDDAIARFLKKGGETTQLPTNYEPPTTSLVGIKG